jgi:hypothetical protein
MAMAVPTVPEPDRYSFNEKGPAQPEGIWEC